MVKSMIKSMKNFMAGILIGVLLNPSLKGFLKGYILLPQMAYDEASETTYVVDVDFIKYDEIPYPVNSAFIVGAGLVPMLLPSIDNPEHRDQAFSLLCSKLLSGKALKIQEGEAWYALTDLKRSGDAIAFCGSYSKLSEVMGAPLNEIADPIKGFKLLLPPSRLRVIGTKGMGKRKTVRLAFASFDVIKTDGGIVSKIGLKHADYDREGLVGPMRYVKYSYQIRHNTITSRDGHKKGKVTYSPSLHRYMCRLAGIDHKACDMICAIDNVKTASRYKVGDICEIPIEEFRVIKLKERQSPTRGGAQIRRIPWSALRMIMAEKGAPNVAAATVMRYASKGDGHAIAHILQVPFMALPAPRPELKAALDVLADDDLGKDVVEYLEDGLGLFIQLLAAAKWTNSATGGYYQVPMYGDPFAAVMGRLRAWYFDYVIKLKLGDYSFYVEVAPHLKGAECILPNVKSLLALANTEGVHLTGLRPPIVSRANLQPLVPKRKMNGVIKTNGTDDTIFVSLEALLAMFGDTDGDVLYIIHSRVKFKFRPRPIEAEAKFKVFANTPQELCNLIRTKSSQVAQASLEVGLRDRAASVIYDEREFSGNPITDEESIRMADVWLENAIKSFKHDGTSIMGEAAISMMCAEFGTDAIKKAQKLPKKTLPQTQLFRRRIGAFGADSFSDKAKMKSLAVELKKFFAHRPNRELGVCTGGPNAHPYLPVFKALEGFSYMEDLDRCQTDHDAFIALWDNTKRWCDNIDKRLQFKIIDAVKYIEDLYNQSASFAITLSSYNGEKPVEWWPFCIYNQVSERKAWANHIFTNKMVFSFTKLSPRGYLNEMSGEVTLAEVYELLSSGRINTLQKRARFKAIKADVEYYVNWAVKTISSEYLIEEKIVYQCLATALGYRVFGIRKSGGAARNAREFMALDDDIKLTIYNNVFKSTWGLVARKAWDATKEHFKALEEVEPESDEDDGF